MAKRGSTRNRSIAKIKVGAKRLGLDHEEYCGLLDRVTGRRSCADLSLPELGRVIEEMEGLGAFGGKRQRPRGSEITERQIAKILAILDEAGRPVEYAQSILQRQTRHPHPVPLTWATAEQLRGVIAALTKDKQRRVAREGA